MRKFFVPAITLFAIVLISSCKKSAKTTLATHSTLSIPWVPDTIMSGTSSGISLVYPASFPNVWGILTVCRISGVLTDTSGKTNLYNRNWESAIFADTAENSLTIAGTVTINSTYLNYESPPDIYTHYDTVGVWNDAGPNYWNATGTSFIPLFSATVDGTMPQFTGILPTTILRSKDLSINFNSSNTINADSARFVLYSLEKGNGIEMQISNMVSGTGGTATISTTKLVNEENSFLSPYGGLSTADPTRYFGGFILIVLYNHTFQTFGGKQFVFVKQRELIGVVQFL